MILLLLSVLLASTNAAHVISLYGDVHKDVEFFTRTFPWIIDNIGGEIIVEYNLLGSGRYSVHQMCALEDLKLNTFLQAQYLKCEAEGKPSGYCLCEAGIDPQKFKQCVASGGLLASLASAKYTELGINLTPVIELEPNNTVYGTEDIWFLKKVCAIFGNNLPKGCINYSDSKGFPDKKAYAQFDRACAKEFPISDDVEKPATTTEWSTWGTTTTTEPIRTTQSPPPWFTTPPPEWFTTSTPTPTPGCNTAPDWWSTTPPPWSTTSPPWSTTPPPWWFTTPPPWSTTPPHEWITTSTPAPTPGCNTAPDWWSTTPPPWSTTPPPWSTIPPPWSTTPPPWWFTTPPPWWEAKLDSKQNKENDVKAIPEYSVNENKENGDDVLPKFTVPWPITTPPWPITNPPWTGPPLPYSTTTTCPWLLKQIKGNNDNKISEPVVPQSELKILADKISEPVAPEAESEILAE